MSSSLDSRACEAIIERNLRLLELLPPETVHVDLEVSMLLINYNLRLSSVSQLAHVELSKRKTYGGEC